jgi:hypothetical protein
MKYTFILGDFISNSLPGLTLISQYHSNTFNGPLDAVDYPLSRKLYAFKLRVFFLVILPGPEVQDELETLQPF